MLVSGPRKIPGNNTVEDIFDGQETDRKGIGSRTQGIGW
jgi:hypothetical protein